MVAKRLRALQQQKLAVGLVLAVIVGILIYLFSVLATEVPLGEYEEGTHYSLIEQPRKVRGNKIEIMEFFSYGCVHCYNLDPNLTDWIEKHQHSVKLVRMPIAANEAWRAYARAYFTMETLGILDNNHNKLFQMIHATGRTLSTAEEFADALTEDDKGHKSFVSTYKSNNISRLLERSDKLARQFKIATVPNIVVQGKYLVKTNRNVGLSRMLEILNFLLDKETENPRP